MVLRANKNRSRTPRHEPVVATYGYDDGAGTPECAVAAQPTAPAQPSPPRQPAALAQCSSVPRSVPETQASVRATAAAKARVNAYVLDALSTKGMQKLNAVHINVR